MRTTTLVLGTGSNASYGFPSGRALRQLILDSLANETPTFDFLVDNVTRADNIRIFREQFRRSGRNSIDAFLAERPELLQIGKAAIAACLIPFENYGHLVNEEGKGDLLYQYLWGFLAERWRELPDGKLRIVTFNYDRSLEQFLFEAGKATFNWSDQDAAHVFSKVPIVHVYGTLGGSGYPGDAHKFSIVRPYDDRLDAETLHLAMESLRVIPEHRDGGDEILKLCNDFLRESQTICFLGFGYDDINVRRLGLSSLLTHHNDGHPNHGKVVMGTVVGLMGAEVERVKKILATDDRYVANLPCERFLRSTGALHIPE